MALPFTTNPAIGGLEELTEAEEALLEAIATLGTAGQVLAVDGAGTGVEWVAAGSGGYTDLTEFTAQTAWRVFYSNGSGAVTELALGADGTFLKSNGATSAPSFATPAGSGDVSKVGTPVDSQVGVWTGDGTIEGDTALTFDTSTDTLTTGILNSTSLTASEIVITDASKNLASAAVATYPSLTELTYVKGVTSAIQTQLGTKAPSTSPTFATSITGSYLTASEILITDGSKNIVSAAVATYPSLTELTYLKGVTSSVQDQLDAVSGAASLDAAYNGGNTIDVDGDAVTMTVSATDNNAVLILNQNDTTNNPNGLEINNAGTGHEFICTNTNAGTIGATVSLFHNSASPADNDRVAYINFDGNNDAASQVTYGRISGNISDASAVVVNSGYLSFEARQDTGTDELLRVGHDGNGNLNGIAVGESDAAGVLSSRGSQDLVLRTGNATTGNITITDGANQDISITPDGTGQISVGGNIQMNSQNIIFSDSFGVVDGNGNETLIFQQVSSAVNYFDVTNAATGNGPQLEATGSDTNIDIELIPKGTGRVTDGGVNIPSISSTDTLTNKRITKRVGSTTSSATPTINTDSYDVYRLTAQAADITSFTTNLSGTPSHGDSLIIEITGTAARAITWGASFEASTVALPTTTVTTAMLTVGFFYNSATSKWRCVASA